MEVASSWPYNKNRIKALQCYKTKGSHGMREKHGYSEYWIGKLHRNYLFPAEAFFKGLDLLPLLFFWYGIFGGKINLPSTFQFFLYFFLIGVISSEGEFPLKGGSHGSQMPLTRYMTTKAYYVSTPYRSPTSGLLSSGVHVVMIEKQPEISFQMRKSSSYLLSLVFDLIPWCLLHGGESNNCSFSQDPLRYFRVVGSSDMKYIPWYAVYTLLLNCLYHLVFIPGEYG